MVKSSELIGSSIIWLAHSSLNVFLFYQLTIQLINHLTGSIEFERGIQTKIKKGWELEINRSAFGGQAFANGPTNDAAFQARPVR